MSRYTKVHPIYWVKGQDGGLVPITEDCIGVFWHPGGNAIPIDQKWHDYSFQTITKAEYETLIEFGMPVLDIPLTQLR